jgi:hypothetical protein
MDGGSHGQERDSSPRLRPLADVCRRGYPGVAVDILNASEITLGDLETAGADASDLEELREAVSPGVRVKR